MPAPQPGPWGLEATSNFVFAGDPNGHVTSKKKGDLCLDITTPALYQANGAASTSWAVVGSGGGGSFPDFTGSGSPEGVQTANVGQSYVDSTNGALYFKATGTATDTGWAVGSVGQQSTVQGAILDENNEWVALIAPGVDSWAAILTDADAMAGSFNGIYFNHGVTGDGHQNVLVRLGPTGQFTWQLDEDGSSLFATGQSFAADGSTSFPGPIKVDAGASLFSNAGDPNGVVTALAKGDVCFDTSTPAIWEAAGAGTVWTQVGGGGASNTPDWINVTDAPYNADPTGATDASAAIQAALDAADAGLGGTVYAPAGDYKIDTGLTATHQGTVLMGDGLSAFSGDGSSGTTNFHVGDGQWGITFGSAASSEFRGYGAQNIQFNEQNAGMALGGVRVLRASECQFNNVAAGAFTNGTGWLVDGTGDAANNNTLIDCRGGTCLVGLDLVNAIGTRLIGGTFSGPATAGTTGIRQGTGDTLRAYGTIVQGYDTLLDLSSNGNRLSDVRLENWITAAVHFQDSAHFNRVTGEADNSSAGSIGTGVIIEAGATDVDVTDLFVISTATTLTDAGTSTRATGLGAVAGSAVEAFAIDGTSLGFIPVGSAATPTDSHTATAAFGALAVGTPKQNTLGYDILVTGRIPVTVAVSGSLNLGVGPTATPTVDPMTGTITAVTTVDFSAVVPNGYFLSVTLTGTLTLGTPVIVATPL